MNTQIKFYLLAVLFAFAGGTLIFTNDSAFADEHNLNTAYVVVGVALAVIACFFLFKSQGKEYTNRNKDIN